MKPTKKVATPTPPPAPEPEPAEVESYDWSQYTSTGLENVSQQDLGIPFLTIVQAGSPEVNRTHQNYQAKKIVDCEPGCIINSLTRQILYTPDGEPMKFIPYGYKRSWVEWSDRNDGGGAKAPVREHSESILRETTKDEKGRDVLKNGNIIVTTAYFFGAVVRQEEDDTYTLDHAVISMTSTQLKKARSWLNIMVNIKLTTPDGKRITPPMFSHIYSLSTIPEANDLGGWFGWNIESAGMVPSSSGLLPDLHNHAKLASASPKQLTGPAPDQDDTPY